MRALIAFLVASSAFAQVALPDGYLTPPTASQQLGLGGVKAATSGPLALFVDPVNGNDANACTASGTSACATVQGAVNRIPKLMVQDQVTVTLAAGTASNYTAAVSAAYISGFHFGVRDANHASSTTAPTINFIGSRTTATVSAGLSSGNIASATQGGTIPTAGPGTWGTVTVNSSGWTTNNLQGFWLNITGGTGAGQVRAISANTNATNGVITIAGAWVTTPDATSTFEIDDCNVTLTTGGAPLPFGLLPNATDPLQTPAAGAQATIVVAGNRSITSASPSVGFQDVCFSAALGHGAFYVVDDDLYTLRVKITNGANRKLAKYYNVGGRITIDTGICALSGFQDRCVQQVMGNGATNTWPQDVPQGRGGLTNLSVRWSAAFMGNTTSSNTVFGILGEGGNVTSFQNEWNGGHDGIEVGATTAGTMIVQSTGDHFDMLSLSDSSIDIATGTDVLGSGTVGIDGDVFTGFASGTGTGINWNGFGEGVISFGGDVTTFTQYKAAIALSNPGVKLLATAATSPAVLPTVTNSTCEYSILVGDCSGTTTTKALIEAAVPKMFTESRNISIMEFP